MSKLCLLLLCSIVLFKVAGQPGSLDPTFGNKGIQTTAFFGNHNSSYEYGSEVQTSVNGDLFFIIGVENSVKVAKYLPEGRLDSSYGNAGYSDAVKLDVVTSAAQQGNKIIVAGYAYDPINNGNDFALVRYTADGMLDSSFGENGKVTTDFNNSDEGARALTLQGDKIILVGYTTNPVDLNEDFALVRYTANGMLDTTFGENGKVITDFNGSYENATSIAIQGDKIIAGGYSNGDFALARYTVDGILDSSFGENGKVTTDFNNSSAGANSIALQENKIILAGNTGDWPSHDFALARYTADGVLDSTFGVNGKVTTDFNNSDDEANSIVLQGDKITVAGTNNIDFALARYTADGVLDSTFGENGKVTTDFSGDYDVAYSIALQGDKIIVGGSTFNSVANNNDFALARYMADGTLDSSFVDNGLLTGYVPLSYTFFTSTAIQGSKIIAAGYALKNNNSYDFLLARYTADGMLDSSFGEKGIVTTDFNNSYKDYASSIILQGDKIIAAGYSAQDFTSDFALARYTADGMLDTTFGENGKVITDFHNAWDQANSIVLQGDKIIVAGYTGYLGNFDDDFALARYTADGTLDSSFGENGIVTTDFNGYSDVATSITIQGDKIIVAGTETDFYFTLARYTADGALDPSFGENGKTITDLGSYSYATSIALQGEKIIVGGYTSNPLDVYYDFALDRYTPDGKLDSSFGINGRVTTDFNHIVDIATSITLQGDKIIAAGYTTDYLNDDFALARYTAEGVLDSSFGENGKVITHLGGPASIQGIALHENRLYAVGSLTLVTGESYGAIAAYQLESPEPTISIADVMVSESKRLAIVTVRLSMPTKQIVRAHYSTRDKTAVHNEDYFPISGPLFFIPGVNTTVKIIIPLIDDQQSEGTEQFEIVLTNGHNATIQDSVGVVIILDNDDALITKQLSTSLHINVNPNPSVNAFIVQLRGTNPKQPINIRVYDMSGRLIEQRNNVSIRQSFHLGDQYTAGTYIIEAVQGSRSVQTKVIRAGK